MSAERTFLALLPSRGGDADAVAEVSTEDGEPLGVLAAWIGEKRPHASAVRVDPRVIDPRGEAMLCSLVLAPDALSLDFDDPSVVAATEEVLALDPSDLVTTFVREGYRFAGALTGERDARRRWRLALDPFARIFPGRILRVGPGLLARVPPPTGPVTQRYGAGNPWPWDRFQEGKGIN